ncbi:capsid protein [Weissella muntiaci]|uniref:Capsid protein n=1 Tax=Weissella muntiaci TaxID=2508881 RepID=A0A6C2C4S7_9LACO|nr:phage minor capsid protein [Weissella muntiaci]TYC48807.1 capsid protein [Weissella muntiaci]
MAKVNEDQMTMLASMVGDIYSSLGQELFMRLIERIKQRGVADLQDNPYLWQLEKLNDMHMLNQENIKLILERTGIAKELLYQIIENEGLKVYSNTAEQLANDLNADTFSYNGVQEALSSLANQTFLDIDNLVNQTLLTTNMSDNATMRLYKKMIEQSVAEVVTGTKTADRAISDVVMKWIDKGISSSFTDKGGHEWSIDRYARTVMESTTYRVYNDMRMQAADEFGISTFHMSSHAAARPACAPIQGHIVTKNTQGFDSGDEAIGYVESIWQHGYGSASGTMGINCHHVLTPFVIGVNELPDEEIPNPKDAIANGEKQAKQRSYERGIRDAKYKLHAAKLLDDKGLVNKYQQLLNSRQAGLRKLLASNDFLNRDYSREKIYQASKIMKSTNKLLREKVGKTEALYTDAVNKLGRSGFLTLQEFKRLVYDNVYTSRLLKQYIKDREELQVETLADFKLYLQVDKQMHDSIDGLKTVDGVIIKSHSMHSISRVIGVRQKGGSNNLRREGISIETIIYTLKYGTVTTSRRSKNVNVYESDRGKVTVNVETGNLIQGSSKER